MSDLLFKEESYAIVGACFEVHNEMGSGFLEQVYQECLAFEFQDRGIPASAQEGLQLRYKIYELKSIYVPDFVCYGKIIVELKCVHELHDSHRAQVINYLRATGLQLGILVNFGDPKKLVYERIVYGR